MLTIKPLNWVVNYKKKIGIGQVFVIRKIHEDRYQKTITLVEQDELLASSLMENNVTCETLIQRAIEEQDQRVREAILKIQQGCTKCNTWSARLLKELGL